MVEVLEAKTVSTIGLGEYMLGGRPMATVVLDIWDGTATRKLVSIVVIDTVQDGEPTWEDAAWQ